MDSQYEFMKELKRRTVNKELMMLYGHQVEGYLPPLPVEERPRSSIARAWVCSNQAMRQLGNVHRRGQRNLFIPGTCPGRKLIIVDRKLTLRPHTAPPCTDHLSRRGPRNIYLPSPAGVESTKLISRSQLERPHTAYASHVRVILNRQYEEERPHTSMAEFESMPCRRLAPQEDLEKLITPAISLARAGVGNIDDDECDYLSVASVDNMRRRPRMARALKHGSKKKKKDSRKNPCSSADGKPREDVMKLLRGEWDTIPVEPPTQVRIYLSANTQDMEEERRLLNRLVFPVLQEHCRALGLDFHVVDLRWGAPPCVDSDLSASGLHLKEIASCQRHSIGPCFLALIGDKYGPMAPPSLINKEEFETVKLVAEEARIGKTYLLEEWYAMDENYIPPIYVLQFEPTGHSYKAKSIRVQAAAGKEAVRQMHDDMLLVLQEAITLATKQGRIHTDKKHRYFQSVLEDEITTGLNQLESPAEHCLVYIRNIKDIPTHTINDLTMRFTDVNSRGKKPQLDETSRSYLHQMKINIRNRLADTSALRIYDTTMKEYVLKEVKQGARSYLEQFCEDIIHDVKDMVQKAQEHWWPTNTGQHQQLYLEVIQHAKKCQQRSVMFMGRHEQLASIQKYIRNPTGRPLIIHGPFGMGKTALMAKMARLNREWLGKQSVVIARFLAITTESNNIKSILQSVIHQMCAVYNLEVPTADVLDSTDQMSRAFVNLLAQVSRYHGEKAPLTILLDGLDTILPAHRSYGLSWLPLSLPPHIRLLVSTDAYRYGILHRLRQRLPNEQDFVDVSELTEKTVEDIFVRTLQKRNRQVTSDQRELLMRLIKGHPRPIYTNTMTNEALGWGCYTNVPVSMLPEITEDAIWRLLVRTENKLGPVLLQHFFSFLTVVPHGLTEVELRDALSCSDEVMQEVVSEYEIPIDDSLVMPSFLLSQLLNEVKWFLSERDMDGKTVLVFQHAIYRRVCSRKYFANDNMFGPEAEGVNKICKALTEIFLQENGIKKIFYQDGDHRGENLSRHIMTQPLEPSNIRKLKLLPYLIAHSGNFHEVRESLKRHCLCNFKWLMCKLQSMPVDAVLLDFSLVEQRDNDIDLVRDFLMQNQSVLRQHPASLGSQLLGCIPRLGSSYRYAMELLDQTKSALQESIPPMLVPLFPSFPSAHELCKAEMWGLAELLVIDRSMQLGVVRSKDSAIEIWDIRNAELVHQLGVRLDKVTCNIFCSDTYVFSLNQADLCIWEIESGMCAYDCDLEDLLGVTMTTYMIIAHTKHFEHVAIHASDDDFNQLVAIIDTRFKKTQVLKDFGLADEFYQNSAVFTDGAEELIFINSTTQSILNDFGEEETSDIVNLYVYSAVNHKYKHKLECGNKKFHSLQLRDRLTVLICWENASFDMYDIAQGANLADMPAPGHNLTLHQCCFNKERDLIFLASQSGQNSSCFSALWLWDVEDQQLTRLLLQEHNHTEQVLKQFIYLDGFHYILVLALHPSTLFLFDTNKSEWVCSIETHSQPAISMVTTQNPFSIYTCSAEEGVLRLWNLHRLFPRYVTMKSNIPITPILVNKAPEVSLRRPSSRRQSRSSKIGSAKSSKSNKSVRFADEGTDDDASSIKSAASSRRELVTVATEDSLSTFLSDDPIDGEIKDFKEEMEAMFGVTAAVFSMDSQYLLTGSERHFPTVWDISDGHILYSLAQQRPEDLATPWLQLACNDRWLVGLTMTAQTKKNYPHVYMFQVWDFKNNRCIILDPELPATACTLTRDRERALVSSVENFDPSGEANWELTFKMMNICDQTVLHEVLHHTQTVPTTLNLSEDDKYVVTNNRAREDSECRDAITFPLDGGRESTYQFQKGKKFNTYEMSFNVVLKNGLSIAVGRHGDFQLWDIQTCEYEGNLYHDRTVKDTINPSLHNHNGKAVTHGIVSHDGHYFLAGSEDGAACLWDLEEETLVHTYGKHVSPVICVGMSDENHLIVMAMENHVIQIYERAQPDQIVCSLHVHILPKVLTFSPDKETLFVNGSRRNEVPRMHILRFHKVPSLEQYIQAE